MLDGRDESVSRLLIEPAMVQAGKGKQRAQRSAPTMFRLEVCELPPILVDKGKKYLILVDHFGRRSKSAASRQIRPLPVAAVEELDGSGHSCDRVTLPLYDPGSDQKLNRKKLLLSVRAI
jgi:hypothetical protein